MYESTNEVKYLYEILIVNKNQKKTQNLSS